MHTFDFQFKDLPQALYDQATVDAGNFATFFVANNQFCGSGTFATLDGCPGILTARHVWDYVDELSTDGRVGYAISNEPHCHLVPKQTLAPMHLAKRVTDEFGPDIEFVRIPAKQAESVQARKSFYNLSKAPEIRKARALAPVGFSLIAGFPDEAKREHPGAHGFKAIIEQVGFGIITAVDERFERGEFDYLKLGISYTENTRPPSDFKGVSGAGVWQFPIGKKAEEPLSAMRYEDFYLIGVAYFQSPVIEGKRFIQAHGQSTIYDFLHRKAAEWQMPKTL
jgi:hypothetical protein